MKKECYELKIQFEKRESYTLLQKYGDEALIKEVNSFLGQFYNYYLSLDEQGQKYFFKNIKNYDKDGWQLWFKEPDEETLSFKNNMPLITLSHMVSENKIQELEMISFIDDDFYRKSLPGNPLEMIKFSTYDGSFSRYNPEFMSFVGVVDKGTKKLKYVTTKGILFGNKTIIKEEYSDSSKNQEEKE